MSLSSPSFESVGRRWIYGVTVASTIAALLDAFVGTHIFGTELFWLVYGCMPLAIWILMTVRARLRRARTARRRSLAEQAGRELAQLRALTAAGLLAMAVIIRKRLQEDLVLDWTLGEYVDERWLAWVLGVLSLALAADSIMIVTRVARGTYGYNALEFAEIARFANRRGGSGPRNGEPFFEEGESSRTVQSDAQQKATT